MKSSIAVKACLAVTWTLGSVVGTSMNAFADSLDDLRACQNSCSTSCDKLANRAERLVREFHSSCDNSDPEQTYTVQSWGCNSWGINIELKDERGRLRSFKHSLNSNGSGNSMRACSASVVSASQCRGRFVGATTIGLCGAQTLVRSWLYKFSLSRSGLTQLSVTAFPSIEECAAAAEEVNRQ